MNDDKFWDLYIKEVNEAARKEWAIIEYNERMRDEYDKHREYMEMKVRRRITRVLINGGIKYD